MASSSRSRQSPREATIAAASLMVPSSSSSGKTRSKQNILIQNGGRPPADPSVLRPSINVSITGMKQAVKALENGSPEIRSYLLHECNVIYECRTCFNMFRSLANYIAHKRSFCRQKLQDVKHVYRRDPDDFPTTPMNQMTSAFVQPEAVETILPEREWDLRQYSPSLELLKEAGLIQEIETRPIVTKLMPQQKKSNLDSVVERLKEKLICGPEYDFYRGKEDQHLVTLEGIRQSSQAVFQTIGSNNSSSMGQRYVELQKLRQKSCVFLGPDGNIITPGPAPLQLHAGDGVGLNKESLTYPCPLCDKKFSLSKGVYRHLIRCHKKPSEEALDLTKEAKKAALQAQHNAVFGNLRIGECSYLPESSRRLPLLICRSCSKIFQNVNEGLCHEIMCRPDPLVHIQRLNMSTLLAKPPPPIEKARSPAMSERSISPNRYYTGGDRKSPSPVAATGYKGRNMIQPKSVSKTSSPRMILNAIDDEDDDNDEVTFKKANEDKDSGIGNGNASEESGGDDEDSHAVVDEVDLRPPPQKRKKMRPSGPAGAASTVAKERKESVVVVAASPVKRKMAVKDSEGPELVAHGKKGLITEFFPKTGKVQQEAASKRTLSDSSSSSSKTTKNRSKNK